MRAQKKGDGVGEVGGEDERAHSGLAAVTVPEKDRASAGANDEAALGALVDGDLRRPVTDINDALVQVVDTHALPAIGKRRWGEKRKRGLKHKKTGDSDKNTQGQRTDPSTMPG